MADELIEIEDDGGNDFVEQERPDGSKFLAFDGERMQRSRLRVDTRKWLLSKALPKAYGDKLTAEVTGKDGGPIETVHTPIELARRMAFVLDSGIQAKDEGDEPTTRHQAIPASSRLVPA